MERPYKCKKCKKSFKFRTSLSNHEKTHLPINERKKYECSLCNKIYLSKKGFKTHMEGHDSNKRLKWKFVRN